MKAATPGETKFVLFFTILCGFFLIGMLGVVAIPLEIICLPLIISLFQWMQEDDEDD